MNMAGERRVKEESMLIGGRNAVKEALASGAAVEMLYALEGAGHALEEEILSAAAAKGIPVKRVSKDKLNALYGSDRHQGIAAVLPPFRYAEVEDMLSEAEEKGEPPFVVVLDGIQEP